MQVRTEIKLSDNINLFEQITFDLDSLLEKLYSNKLKKADRELIVDYLVLVYELRLNQE